MDWRHERLWVLVSLQANTMQQRSWSQPVESHGQRSHLPSAAHGVPSEQKEERAHNGRGRALEVQRAHHVLKLLAVDGDRPLLYGHPSVDCRAHGVALNRSNQSIVPAALGRKPGYGSLREECGEGVVMRERVVNPHPLSKE